MILYLSIKRIVDQFIVTGPVYEVLPTHDDVAIDSIIDTGLDGPGNVVRQRFSHPHDQSLGDAVHLGSSNDPGIGEPNTW